MLRTEPLRVSALPGFDRFRKEAAVTVHDHTFVMPHRVFVPGLPLADQIADDWFAPWIEEDEEEDGDDER